MKILDFNAAHARKLSENRQALKSLANRISTELNTVAAENGGYVLCVKLSNTIRLRERAGQRLGSNLLDGELVEVLPDVEADLARALLARGYTVLAFISKDMNADPLEYAPVISSFTVRWHEPIQTAEPDDELNLPLAQAMYELTNAKRAAAAMLNKILLSIKEAAEKDHPCASIRISEFGAEETSSVQKELSDRGFICSWAENCSYLVVSWPRQDDARP